MARNNPVRAELLEQVKNRQRAAGRKVSRLKTKGVNVSGTKHDVRRPMEKVNRYTVPQLRSYLGQLQTFTSRSTRFYPDAQGRPLPPAAVARYKKAERELNQRKKKALDKIGNIKAPGAGGLTIKQRLAVVTQTRPKALSAANPFTFVTRESRNMKNEQALAKLTKSLEKTLKTDFMKSQLNSGRKAARELLTTLRQPDMIKDIDKMSDFHFNILWNATTFAKDISTPYHIAQSLVMKGNKSSQWMDELLDENMENSKDLIKKVKKIKPR